VPADCWEEGPQAAEYAVDLLSESQTLNPLDQKVCGNDRNFREVTKISMKLPKFL
jgi:hypothetical protein